MAKVKIPIKIASEANNNDHWRLKSKRHKIQKAIVRSYMKTIVTPPLPCKIILKRIAPRKFDFDNLCISFKWILDQLCDILIPGLAPGRAKPGINISQSWSKIHLKDIHKLSKSNLRGAIRFRIILHGRGGVTIVFM